MSAGDNKPGGRRLPKSPVWILVALMIALIVGFALNGIIRGTGEAAGVTGAAPGGTNAIPATGAAGG